MSKLSNRIEAIEYIHAADGLPYRHAFKSGATISLRKDGSVLIRNRDKKLWDTFDVDGREQQFLVNPPGGKMAAKRKKKSTRRRRRTALTAAQAQYFAPKRRRRNNRPKAAAPRKRHRRRRNPMGFSINGILGKLQRGGMDAVCVVGGKAGVRLVSSRFSYEDGSMMDSLVETAAALGISLVAERVLGSDRARFVLAGGLASALETLISQANIPQLSPLLGATPRMVNTTEVYAAADNPRLAQWQDGAPKLGDWQAPAGRRRIAQPVNAPYVGYPSLAGAASS